MTQNGTVAPDNLTENTSNPPNIPVGTTGVVIGKFMPPHRGHEYLAQFASAFVDKLWIFVCSLPGEPIPGEFRYQWMQALFPQAEVVHIHEVNPAANRNQHGAQGIWAQAVLRHTNSSPNFVFASEEYGWDFAKALGARFIPVDPSRDQFPISGSELRRNPFRNWHFIPGVVRSYFVKEIGIRFTDANPMHAEDITQKAALLLNTLYVPDYGAFYQQFSGSELLPISADSLVRAQFSLIKALKSQSRCFLLRILQARDQTNIQDSGVDLVLSLSMDHAESGSGMIDIDELNSPDNFGKITNLNINCSVNTAAHAIRDIILDHYKDLF